MCVCVVAVDRTIFHQPFSLLQLMSTVEEAIKDVHGLHSKLDRKTTVECANKASSAQFKQVYIFAEAFFLFSLRQLSSGGEREWILSFMA